MRPGRPCPGAGWGRPRTSARRPRSSPPTRPITSPGPSSPSTAASSSAIPSGGDELLPTSPASASAPGPGPGPEPQPRRTPMAHFNWLDITVFVAYLLASLAIGTSFFREEESLSEYFVASGSMGRVVVAMTILAVLFAGISVLATPSETYVNGFAFYLANLGFFVTTPITTLLF